MYYYRKTVRTGIAVMFLCAALTAGCSAAPSKADTFADTENETEIVIMKEPTTAAEPTKETESPAAESAAAALEETTEKETATEETVSEFPLEMKEIPGISAVAGYVTSGKPFDKRRLPFQ